MLAARLILSSPEMPPRPRLPSLAGALALHVLLLAVVLVAMRKNPPAEAPSRNVTMLFEQPAPMPAVAVPNSPPPPQADTPAPTPAVTPEPPLAEAAPAAVAPRPVPLPVAPRARRDRARPALPAAPAAMPAAPAAPAAVPAMPTPAAVTDIAAGWRGQLAAWLQAHKTYPDAARRDAEQGRVMLRFTVDRSGEVVDVTVIDSSGSAALDAAAQAMLRGARLPPFPAAMTQGRVTVTVPIRYALQE